jgi:asparagine synthase (glutamine-hydrolysing)
MTANMCGISGYFRGTFHRKQDQSSVLHRMSTAISYRGPDDSGEWSHSESMIALAHRRLSILDVSAAGHQPMMSASGRYVITYNGEIYNHLELRKSFTELSWHGNSDTETILACIEYFGLEETLKKCTGMFAFALWDRELKCLTLARDRMGEKPLYFGWQGRTFMFASELKALKAHPDFKGNINLNSVSLFLQYGYINAPHSIYTAINKLLPGTFVTLNEHTAVGSLPEPRSYWSLKDIGQKSRLEKPDGTIASATDELEAHLLKAVKGQMLSDVPLGAFLSGGIDSSLVVSLMQKLSTKPIKTFAIGFNEKGYNEAHFAKKVAEHLGTDHTEFYVSENDAMSVIPKLSTIYDEPFGDSSAIPTILVSTLAKKSVSVSLSGDGGDELFCGYSRYFTGDRNWRQLNRVPLPLKNFTAVIAKFLSSYPMNQSSEFFGKLIARQEGHSVAERLKTLAGVLRYHTQEEYYRNQMCLWRDPVVIDSGEVEYKHWMFAEDCSSQPMNFFDYAMRVDMQTYLPGDILTKVDRAGMSVSLESRIPFLDHNVVEFALNLPLEYKVLDGKGKFILRKILNRYIPNELVERKKMGFGVPVDYWIRGAFKEWAEDLLSESRLKYQGLLDHKLVRERLRQHTAMEHNWKDSLWCVLMLQQWFDGK